MSTAGPEDFRGSDEESHYMAQWSAARTLDSSTAAGPSYADFLAAKRLVVPPCGIADPPDLAWDLFDFQAAIARWALRRGKAAIWADCGLGKSWMALEWARVVAEHTGAPVLILTPLAVAAQFIREGEKLGIEVHLAREHDDVQPIGIHVANYERVHKLGAERFAGIVLDESSILKDYTGKTRNELVALFQRTPFKLCCTATPAPNDHMELGNHAEFLGVLTRTEMLATFFVHDGGETQKWRLKGHAEADFWRWLASWAVNLRRPADLGFSARGYDLPPLEMHQHVVEPPAGAVLLSGSQRLMFAEDAVTLTEQREARRDSLEERVRLAADLVNAEADEPWIVWCDLNAESEALAAAIPGAVEVRGSMSTEEKERALASFSDGERRVMVTKPSIAGWGLNWQHCARVAFVGLSHSYEQWYQAIRRSWRFGQTRGVACHIITSSREGAVLESLRRKQLDAERLGREMVAAMADITRAELVATEREADEYAPTVEMVVPDWLRSEAA